MDHHLILTEDATLADCAFYSTMLCGVMEAVNHLENDGHSNAQVAVAEVAEMMMRQLDHALENLASNNGGKANA